MTGAWMILGREVLLAMRHRKGNALRRDIRVPSEISWEQSAKYPDKNGYQALETKVQIIFGDWNLGLGIISKEFSLEVDEVSKEISKSREGERRVECAAGKETFSRQPLGLSQTCPWEPPALPRFNPTNQNQSPGSQPPSQSLDFQEGSEALSQESLT